MIRPLCTAAAALVAAASHVVSSTHGALPPMPAVTELAEVGNDYFFQGEYVGNLAPFGRVGLQTIAEGNDQLRAVVRCGGLPGEGWSGIDGGEYVGALDGLTARLAGPTGTLQFQVGAAVLRDAAGRQLGLLRRVERRSPTLGRQPPPGAVVLFDGTSTDAWENGRLTSTGLLMHGTSTKRPLGDFDLHLEFRTPYMTTARGQARGNSGLYIQQRYEVQILDSFGLAGEHNECGGIYKTKRPDVNMCLPPLVWQTYDVTFRAARFNPQGVKIAAACLTVIQNGTTIHCRFAVPDKTGGGKPEGPEPLPLLLQDHGNPVVYRNVWMVDRSACCGN